MPTEVMTQAHNTAAMQRDARAELAVLERYYSSLMDRLLGPCGAALPRDEFERIERMAQAIEDRMLQFDCLEQQLDEMFEDFEPFSLFADLTR
jgi:hypothetical protein